MKTIKTLLLTLCISVMGFAQQGINYKAIIKDGSGNILASSPISIQFIIYEGAALTNNVYQESYNTIMTDANGILIVNIGEGTTGDVFTDIDWGSDDHFLNVQVDSGTGLVDMGTTEFMAVPYALSASSVVDGAFKSSSGQTVNINLFDNFVFGSTQLNDTGDLNHDSRMIFNKSTSAFRAGYVDGVQWDQSNTGARSFATGYNTTASGFASSAFGSTNTASGLYASAFGHLSTASGNWSTVIGASLIASADYSIAMGRGSEASGENATAMGNNTIASGNVSTAMGIDNIASAEGSTAMGLATVASGSYATSLGQETDAESYGSVALGRYNVGGGTAGSWIGTDELFEVGIGTSNINRANALTVLKNGYVGIGTSVPIYNLDIYSSGGIGARINILGTATTTKYGLYTNVLNSGDFQQYGIYNNVQGAGNANHHGTFNNMGGDGAGSKYGTYNSLNGDGDGSHYGYYSTVVGNGSGNHYGYYTDIIANGSGNNFGNRNILSGAGLGNKYGIHNYMDPAAGGTHFGVYSIALKSGSFAGYFLGNVAVGTSISNTYILPFSRGNDGDIMQTDGSGNVSWNSVVSSTGLEALDEGNGIGWRLVNVDPAYHGDIGFGAVDLMNSNIISTTAGATGSTSVAMGFSTTASGDYSTALGFNSTAIGDYSTAMGFVSIASGVVSTAMGENTNASGPRSTSMGNLTTASGDASTAMGINTMASGDNSAAMGSFTTASGENSIAMGAITTASGYTSTAMGLNTTASGTYTTAMGVGTNSEAYASMVIGRYNISGGNIGDWVVTDKLFEVGNGDSDVSRSNALTIIKNGNVGISTDTPTTKLHITDGGDADLTNGSGYFLMGEENGINIVMDNNEIMARNNGGNSTLFFQIDGGAVNVGDELLIGGDVKVNGILVHASDRRLKKDIESIPYGLEEVLQLKPMAYNWKNRDSDHKSLGLIAQDVQKIIEGLVVNDESTNKLAVNYTELIPVLIKAIQEQQLIITNQASIVEELEAKLSENESRMDKIEALLKVN